MKYIYLIVCMLLCIFGCKHSKENNSLEKMSEVESMVRDLSHRFNYVSFYGESESIIGIGSACIKQDMFYDICTNQLEMQQTFYTQTNINVFLPLCTANKGKNMTEWQMFKIDGIFDCIEEKRDDYTIVAYCTVVLLELMEIRILLMLRMRCF
jgi:hypothetical protein